MLGSRPLNKYNASVDRSSVSKQIDEDLEMRLTTVLRIYLFFSKFCFFGNFLFVILKRL